MVEDGCLMVLVAVWVLSRQGSKQGGEGGEGKGGGRGYGTGVVVKRASISSVSQASCSFQQPVVVGRSAHWNTTLANNFQLQEKKRSPDPRLALQGACQLQATFRPCPPATFLIILAPLLHISPGK